VEIIAQDSQGNKVDAKVVVTRPSGEHDTLATGEYKPSEAGTYTVSASKEGYQTATGGIQRQSPPPCDKGKNGGTEDSRHRNKRRQPGP